MYKTRFVQNKEFIVAGVLLLGVGVVILLNVVVIIPILTHVLGPSNIVSNSDPIDTKLVNDAISVISGQ